jgi:hypothetical protein
MPIQRILKFQNIMKIFSKYHISKINYFSKSYKRKSSFVLKVSRRKQLNHTMKTDPLFIMSEKKMRLRKEGLYENALLRKSKRSQF